MVKVIIYFSVQNFIYFFLKNRNFQARTKEFQNNISSVQMDVFFRVCILFNK